MNLFQCISLLCTLMDFSADLECRWRCISKVLEDLVIVNTEVKERKYTDRTQKRDSSDGHHQRYFLKKSSKEGINK